MLRDLNVISAQAQLRDLIREHTRAFRSDEGAREAAADAPPAPKRQKT